MQNKLTLKDKIALSRAIGLIEGCLRIKEMKDLSKEGLEKNLEEVKEILITISENYDE